MQTHPSEWDTLLAEMRGESQGAGNETCACGAKYYDPQHLANQVRQCKRRKTVRTPAEGPPSP